MGKKGTSHCREQFVDSLKTKLELSYDSAGASLIAQLVKNLPAMQETQVRFLGWEDPLEKV